MLYGVTILYFCLRQPGAQKESIPHLDKLVHLTCYLVYAFSLQQILKRKYRIGILIYCILFGVVVEFLQEQTGYRSFEYADMLANSLGALLGIFIGKWQVLKVQRYL
jgi:VanZ family protein